MLASAMTAISALLGTPASRDVGLALLLLTGTITWHDTPIGATPWWVATGFCLIAVLVRRHWPLPALIVAVAGTVTHLALVAGPTLADLAAPIVLAAVASRYRRPVSAVVLGATVVAAAGWSLFVALDGRVDGWALGEVLPPEGALLAVPVQQGQAPGPLLRGQITRLDGGPTDWGALPLFGGLVGGWAIGAGARSRRAYLEELTRRARDLERERDQQAALVAAAERSRLVRELHDVVAHGLSVIVMQAQGGAAAFEKRPGDTRAALDAIVDLGRSSLADIRQVLAAVGPVDGSGLDGLPRLLERVRAAGTPVRLIVDGPPRVLAAPVDLSAYRIIQEALTNTMKHAGEGAKAQVRLTYEPNRLGIEVLDHATAPAADSGSGNGLRGMRERVALVGGELSAGPGQHGGFAVRARIPMGPGE